MRFLELTAPKLRTVDREETLVVLPIAACEQHGPHAPTGTDTIICEAVALAVEEHFHDQLLLLPTLWLGASEHHLRFGATLTTTLPVYTQLLEQIAEPLLNDGYRRLLLLNGHGGNVDPLKAALRSLQIRHPRVLLAGHSYWSVAEQEIASILEGEEKTLGHACEAETSLIQFLRPELIDESRIENCGSPLADMKEGLFISRDMFQRTRNGATGRPDLASAEKGERLFAAILKRMQIAVQMLLEEPLPE